MFHLAFVGIQECYVQVFFVVIVLLDYSVQDK